MRITRIALAAAFSLSLAACGSSTGTPPGAPTNVSVAPGPTAGTAVVSFTAPASSGTSAIAGYTVTVLPGGISATGASSPITVNGLLPATAYAYSVVAISADGSSTPATTGILRFYSVVQTFTEPMTAPNDSIFTGTFTFDTTAKVVSNLTGSLTQSMSGSPMTTVPLAHQLSSVAASPGGVNGLLVTTFKNASTFTLDPATGTTDPTGFAPGGIYYYGLAASTPNPNNAYAMIFVNTTDVLAVPLQAQLDKMAYADCTPGGMMMTRCMTGTTVAGYGRVGTMRGEPTSQVITER